MTCIALVNKMLRLSIAPELGAGIADFSVLGPSGFYYPMMRRAAPEETNASLLGSFIMAPWANRIAGAKFVFEGREIALRVNTADGTAQHGDVRKRPWKIVRQDSASVTLAYESKDHADSNWAWKYACEAEYVLEDSALVVSLRVRNLDAAPFPTGCGHHPYFSRRLWDDRDVIELRAPVSGRYPLKAACAIGPAAPDDLSRRLANLATIPDEHIDTVFAGFGGTAELRWPSSGVTLRMKASSSMNHLVLFAPHANGKSGTPLPFIAVEPQTQVNDAFNLGARGVKGTGTIVLNPGEEMLTECRFAVGT
ncbi:MAG: hypothetical protein J0L78_04715 [Planctomycetes bacterium]|nr:hypothetical protein [Planctomycetota bacterium]